MTTISYKVKRGIGTIFILLLLFSFSTPFVKTAHAQAATVPIGTSFEFNSIMAHTKSFVLDGLAWHVAKILVQHITADTVQWINSGFQGSPAYLTNPEGYFANLGDQVTGAFIADTVILSGLSSPFNVDVRLSLALGEAGYEDNYVCTLSTIINNVQNSTINGSSIQGFMNGDFSQGGWPALIAISEPNNNESGVYLQAQSDMLAQIAANQGQVQQQLTQGGGFLSWQSCNDVSATQINNSAAGTAQLGGIDTGGPALNQSLATYQNTTGNTVTQSPSGGGGTYQSCTTETPGSVINSQLEKQLGSGVDQLNLANSINEVVDALLSQLVTKVLQNGLGGASTNSSGNTQTYVNQLSAEANNSSTYAADAQNVQTTLSPYIADAQNISSIYQQAVNTFGPTLTDFNTAQNCFNNLLATQTSLRPTNTSVITNDMSSISSMITQVNQAQQTYQTKLTAANNNVATIQNQVQSTSQINTFAEDQNAIQQVQQFLATNNTGTVLNVTNVAKADLTTAQNSAKSFDTQAKNYITQCQTYTTNQ